MRNVDINGSLPGFGVKSAGLDDDALGLRLCLSTTGAPSLDSPVEFLGFDGLALGFEDDGPAAAPLLRDDFFVAGRISGVISFPLASVASIGTLVDSEGHELDTCQKVDVLLLCPFALCLISCPLVDSERRASGKAA